MELRKTDANSRGVKFSMYGKMREPELTEAVPLTPPGLSGAGILFPVECPQGARGGGGWVAAMADGLTAGILLCPEFPPAPRLGGGAAATAPFAHWSGKGQV